MSGKNESGFALITTLLVLVLLGVLLEGLILSVNSEQELVGIDRSQSRAFYGALTGLETLTARLGDNMDLNASLSQADLDAITATPPSPTGSYGISFPSDGYQIVKGADRNGEISSGIYAGLKGLITPYTLTSTARIQPGQQEVKMVRDLHVVQIPVFQFGVFAENDMNIYPGSNFDFGGRVHCNGNLYLASSSGTLYLRKKVTAVGAIVRDKYSNGATATNGGTVSVAAPGGKKDNGTPQPDPRPLTVTEGSSAATWKTKISPLYYNSNIMNGATGTRRMDLPITNTPGASPIDLIKRSVAGEETSNLPILKERHFALASMRILLSDDATDITSLPYVSSNSPIHLTGTPVTTGKAHVVGESLTATANFKTVTGTSLIDGYIKIEIRTNSNVTTPGWQDVTSEILEKGFTGPDHPRRSGSSWLAQTCPDNSSYLKDAIIRFQHIKDTTSSADCDPSGTGANIKSWPNMLYDTREGALRLTSNPTDVHLGGVMHYVELDITNLCAWLKTKTGVYKPNEGYLVYFSDRRTNNNTSSEETGEYGNDSILFDYPDASFLGTSRTAAGDVNNNDVVDDYGRTAIIVGNKSSGGWTTTIGPKDTVTKDVARINRAIFFRRALKLVHGKTIDLALRSDNIPYGLSITSENPVYVQGDYNAPGTPSSTNNGFATTEQTRVAAAVMADAVTLLSNSWKDVYSFYFPHATEGVGRDATTTAYSMAIISGTNKLFQNASGTLSINFGTEGGLHNFLRYIENWRQSSTQQYLWYEGSLVNFYYSRQAVGIFKNGGDNPVYYQPNRQYKFNVDFQNPSKLPPYTPRFRDINITGFTQLKMAQQ
jgi:hypothetical protein